MNGNVNFLPCPSKRIILQIGGGPWDLLPMILDVPHRKTRERLFDPTRTDGHQDVATLLNLDPAQAAVDYVERLLAHPAAGQRFEHQPVYSQDPYAFSLEAVERATLPPSVDREALHSGMDGWSHVGSTLPPWDAVHLTLRLQSLRGASRRDDTRTIIYAPWEATKFLELVCGEVEAEIVGIYLCNSYGYGSYGLPDIGSNYFGTVLSRFVAREQVHVVSSTGAAGACTDWPGAMQWRRTTLPKWMRDDDWCYGIWQPFRNP